MSIHQKKKNIAIWAVTPGGEDLANKIIGEFPDADLFLSENLRGLDIPSIRFKKLPGALSPVFGEYRGHIFIMSAGIAVRVIAPLIVHKTVDPAVVVVDETGRHVISLLSGHIGGANRLATDVAQCIGAVPVITTATDLNEVPAIDLLAVEKGLYIENTENLKKINMAFLKNEKVYVHDTYGFLKDILPQTCRFINFNADKSDPDGIQGIERKNIPAIFIDDIRLDLPSNVLILRPGTLVAGIGCNRNTPKQEMHNFLYQVLNEFNLSPDSLQCIATIDIKADEPGLIALSQEIELPLKFYDREALNRIENIETPSETVEKHIGVKSVCEAAAILASNKGNLIVPKQSTRNVTVAVARKSFTS